LSYDEIRTRLVQEGTRFMDEPRTRIAFTGDAAADALVNDLDTYPHGIRSRLRDGPADQGEKAWLIPYAFRRSSGTSRSQALRAAGC